MAYDIWYSIKNNRIKQAFISGFNIEGKDMLRFDQSQNGHFLYLREIDGVADDALWGRFTCDLKLSEELICYIYVAATNFLTTSFEGKENINISDYLCSDEISRDRKMTLINNLGAKRFVNTDDFLLYDLKGRYLFVAVEMIGGGKAHIGKMRIGVRGDNFMGSFPEVYQDRNSFFHRYLSIFSSIYNDMSEQNEKLYEMLDLDKCLPEQLEMYASWFGINISGGGLSTDTMRTIVKEAYQLSRMKGTKWAIERVLEIMLGQKYVLYENRLTNGEFLNITILIDKKLTEQLRHQILFMLDQFKPVRVKVKLMQMEREAVIDGNNYLDINASIPAEKHVVLDKESIYDGAITLV